MIGIMVDLETMGNGPTAAITAIGAADFDSVAGEIQDKFYMAVDLQSSVDLGGVIDPATVAWWLGQSDAARAEMTRSGAHINIALMRFKEFVRKNNRGDKEVTVWGNGATFDNVILSSAYRNSGIDRPWSYKADRCYRTIRALRPEIEFDDYGTLHNALDDAIGQAFHLMKILKAMGID